MTLLKGELSQGWKSYSRLKKIVNKEQFRSNKRVVLVMNEAAQSGVHDLGAICAPGYFEGIEGGGGQSLSWWSESKECMAENFATL